MRDWLEIGASPADEDCAQIGSDDYPEKSRLECRVFANQLRRVFGDPPSGAEIGVKAFRHDFGTYREVVVFFDDAKSEEEENPGFEYAINVENNTPEKWDILALKELAEGLRKLARRDVEREAAA